MYIILLLYFVICKDMVEGTSNGKRYSSSNRVFKNSPYILRKKQCVIV